MNRIEMAAANCRLEPMTVESPESPVAAAVAAFFAAAAFGYAVGYTAHNLGAAELPENLPECDGITLESSSGAELLAVRRDLVGA